MKSTQKTNSTLYNDDESSDDDEEYEKAMRDRSRKASAKKQDKTLPADMRGIIRFGKTKPPPSKATTLNQTAESKDSDDMNTPHVVSPLPTTDDPVKTMLSVLSPEHRKLFDEMQTANAKLKEDAKEKDIQIFEGKRKIDEYQTEKEVNAKRVKVLEVLIANKPPVPPQPMPMPVPTPVQQPTPVQPPMPTPVQQPMPMQPPMPVQQPMPLMSMPVQQPMPLMSMSMQIAMQMPPMSMKPPSAMPMPIPPPPMRTPPPPNHVPVDPALYEAQVNDELEEEDQELEVYSKYKPVINGGSPHPTALCSSTNLSDLISDEVRADLQCHLNHATVTNRKISDAQLEAIALCRRRNVVDKLAFACGDGTGVGKTRVALGNVLNQHAFVSGKKPRVLYISVANLYDDVVRDAKEIGLNAGIYNGNRMSKKGKADICIADSILFVSHNVITSFTPQKLMHWLLEKKKKATPGKEPILIIDEVHKLANKTKRGSAAAELLNDAHVAGVHIMVLSATFASNVPQLELAAKVTGLIRSEMIPDHPICDFKTLSKTMRRLGEVGLEALTMQMKMSGGFVARSLGMQGVEFESIEAAMSVVDVTRYEAASAVWKDLFEVADAFTMPKTQAVYYSASLRFFKALTMLIRLPAVISNAIDCLERGESVILTCLSTDEASISRSVAGVDDDADDTDEIQVSETEAESRLKNGALLDCVLQIVSFARRNTDSAPVLDELSRIEARAKGLGLPVVGALDVAKHRLASALGNDRSKVVELTGRQKQLKCEFGNDLADKMNWAIVSRDESLLDGKKRFQDGTARVALLSAAASTGCSLHDLTGSRRVMIAMELPYSSIQFCQTAGRSHRSGQLSAPKIMLVTLPEVKAEARFAASICARLAQLGAISTGDRRSGAGCVDFGDSAALAGPVANKAALSAAIRYNISLGSTPTSIKLMNRCLAKPPAEGNQIMQAFQDELSLLQSSAKGTSGRVKDIEVDGTRIKEIDSLDRLMPNGIAGRSMVKTYQIDNGVTFDAAVLKCVGIEKAKMGFYKKKNIMNHNVSSIVLAELVYYNEDEYTVTLIRPNGSKTTIKGEGFPRAYEAIDEHEDARIEWDFWLKSSSVFNGSRFKKFFVLTMPVIDLIASRYMSTLKLVRMQNDNSVLLGIHIDAWVVNSVQKSNSAAAAAAALPTTAQAVPPSSST